jgi:hypothetical protein
LIDPLSKEHIRWQGGHQIKTTLQEPNSERVGALDEFLLGQQIIPLRQQVCCNHNDSERFEGSVHLEWI